MNLPFISAPSYFNNMVATRSLLVLSRPSVRRGAFIVGRTPAGPRSLPIRHASSAPPSSNPTQTKSSDTPWAIASAVIFGSLFVYLTSPASKTHNEHGQITGGKSPSSHGTGKSKSDDQTGDEAVWKQEDGHEASEHQHEAEHDEDTPEGDKHLKASRDSSKGAHDQKSPSSKERDSSNSTSGIQNSNFEHGVSASKDGEHVSDPKKVVAKAQSDKQDKKADKEAQETTSKMSEKDEGESSVEEDEGAE